MKFNATLLGFAAVAATCLTAMADPKWPTPLPSNPVVATNTTNQATPGDATPAAMATETAAVTNAPVAPAAALPDGAAVATSAPADTNAATNIVVVVVPTNSTVVVTTNTTATAAPAVPAAAVATPAPATPEPAGANGAHDPSAVIPLIVMDEVPLIDAIKNLARQAGLNYMLDPKITQLYGGPDANGVVHAQPNVSLRWENLTADQALSAVLNNNNLVILDDPKTKIARITVKDPSAPDPLETKIIQLKYASASNMVVNTSSILTDKRSKVIADIRTSQLVVVATEKELNSIDELVARLDTPTKQVLIEARLVATSKNPTSSKGVDWSGTLQAQHITFGNGNTSGTYNQSGIGSTGTASGNSTGLTTGSSSPPFIAANPVTVTSGTPSVTTGAGSGSTSGNVSGNSIVSALTSTIGAGGFSANTAQGIFPYTAFLNADGASAVLSFLNNNYDATVLSTPRAVTLDNEEATLSVTVAQPIFETTAGTQGSPGGSQVNYTNLGTILKVTPRISANNTINLKVVPEVSDILGTVTKTVSGQVNQADAFDIRRIETHVLIPSGNTLVMGGLVSDNRTKNNTKVPILGDIPFLGMAFRSESKTQNKQNLLIFVTPTIVEAEDFQPTETSFLKTKVPDLKAADFGAWDSSTPQDWSKLIHAKKTTNNVDNVGDIPTTN